jgi:hypothetical protein
MSNGFMMDEEIGDLENFVAWWIWRCNRGEIRSTFTQGVAKFLAKKYHIDVDKLAKEYDFENLSGFGVKEWRQFSRKGMFPND